MEGVRAVHAWREELMKDKVVPWLMTGLMVASCVACIGSDERSREDVDMRSADSSPEMRADLDMASWQWIDVPESVCGNGAPTGVALNPSVSSDQWVIFFQGGGACWDVESCFVLKSAVNIESGYTAARFQNEPDKSLYIFDREDPENPFRDANYLYIPYCTGDLHNGDRVMTYSVFGQPRDVHHRGAHNMTKILETLSANLGDASKIFMVGVSAGGYGAQFHYEHIAKAAPQAEVHLLADGAPLVNPVGGRLGQMDRAWDLHAPEACASCKTSFPAWLDYLQETYPDGRLGLLTFDADQVIWLYFAYPLDGSFQAAVQALLQDHYSGNPLTTSAFVLQGGEHVMLNRPNLMRGDVPLRQWISWWASGDAQWVNVP